MVNSEQGMLTKEECEQILLARAVALAQNEEVSALAPHDYLDVLQFRLAGEVYAFELQYVGEVYPAKKVTAIPCTPPFIAGVVNVRGQILTTIDARLLLGLSVTENVDTNLIILKTAEERMAFLVDEIIGIASIPLIELKPAPQTMSATQIRFIQSLTALPLIVLDAVAIVNDREIVVDEEV